MTLHICTRPSCLIVCLLAMPCPVIMAWPFDQGVTAAPVLSLSFTVCFLSRSLMGRPSRQYGLFGSAVFVFRELQDTAFACAPLASLTA